MKILLDHCVPRPLRRALIGHDVRTTFELGWSDLQNGRLLAAAATAFDVLLTVDQNLAFEQNLSELPISVIIMVANSNRLEALEPLVPFVEIALKQLVGKQMLRVDESGNIEIVH